MPPACWRIAARRSIALECYIFHPGRIGGAFTTALVERAMAGVDVRVVLDAFGSRRLRREYVARLAAAGCQIAWHPRSRWRRAHRLTNSTHREILVVDGSVAFTGGAGISEWWASEYKGQPPWRDTMIRIEGPVVGAVQAVFAENWLECSGGILTGDEWFPALPSCGPSAALVTRNSPSFEGSRALLQALVECAEREIRLTTPYFIPDPSFLATLIERARSGVAVTILVPGPSMDHRWVRLSSRRLFRPLLDAGVRIFEYQPSMIHQKLIIVDELWSIVGTMNLDMLSFEYLDEISVAVRDAAFARDWQARQNADLARSVGTLSLVLRNQVDTQALVTGGARPAELLSLSKAATADKDQNNRRGSRSGRRTSAPVNVHVHVEVLKGTERSAVEF